MVITRAELLVEPVAWTVSQVPNSLVHEFEFPKNGYINGGDQVAELAGRACYQSWSRPNPKTATNAGYIENILDTGHLSVLEHGSVSFYISGVSRSLTHELVRHRHLSFSQLSQRYVPSTDVRFVCPPDIEGDDRAELIWEQGCEAAMIQYAHLLETLQAKFYDVSNATERKKKARQAARSLLPNCTETKIVVTGNLRAWRHFIDLRATAGADVEIRALAVEVLRKLANLEPSSFADYEIVEHTDGTEIATSPHHRVDG